MSILSYPTLDVNSVNIDESYILLSNNEFLAANATSSALLARSPIKFKPKYFFKSLMLDVNSRQAKLDIFAFLYQENLLAENSQFECYVDFFVDLENTSVNERDGPLSVHKTFNLPSLFLYKNFGSNLIIAQNFDQVTTFTTGFQDSLLMSSINYNNNNYSLKSVLSLENDSISFSNISYARNQIFKTRINFTFTSWSLSLSESLDLSGAPSLQISPPVWSSSEESIDVVDNSISLFISSSIDTGGEDVVYSISGVDAGKLSLDQTSGHIYFNEPVTHQDQSIFNFTITATNSAGSSSLSVVVNVISGYTVYFPALDFDGVFDATLLESMEVDDMDNQGELFPVGSRVYLVNYPAEGFEFNGWYFNNPRIELDANDSFIMPAEDVSFTPVFRAV